MTTTSTTPAARTPQETSVVVPQSAGTVRLKLAALGIDHRAPDFPVRFIEFCKQNDLYEMEVNAEGELLILPMTGFRGNRHETNLNGHLFNWRDANGGIHASQTSRFRLQSGDILGPDAAWMTQERFDAQPAEQQETVIDGAPDVVVEIRSNRDNLRPLRNKMVLWMAAGCRLGWLIDARDRRVFIYRAGQGEPETLEDPETIGGEDVLPGFVFPVRRCVFDLE